MWPTDLGMKKRLQVKKVLERPYFTSELLTVQALGRLCAHFTPSPLRLRQGFRAVSSYLLTRAIILWLLLLNITLDKS